MQEMRVHHKGKGEAAMAKGSNQKLKILYLMKIILAAGERGGRGALCIRAAQSVAGADG